MDEGAIIKAGGYVGVGLGVGLAVAGVAVGVGAGMGLRGVARELRVLRELKDIAQGIAHEVKEISKARKGPS